jgi:hypothetical protein
LLFVPHSGKFPYHLTGLGGKSELESIGGLGVKSGDVHVLTQILSSTLSDTSLSFLGASDAFGEECHNAGAGVINTGLLLGHLGFADHEGKERPAILLLLGKVHFFCKIFGAEELVLVRGGVIGEITKPALNTASEELLLSFVQHAGVQLLRTILFGSTLVTSDEESSLNEGSFELSGQSGEATLKALAKEGTFLLVSP